MHHGSEQWKAIASLKLTGMTWRARILHLFVFRPPHPYICEFDSKM